MFVFIVVFINYCETVEMVEQTGEKTLKRKYTHKFCIVSIMFNNTNHCTKKKFSKIIQKCAFNFEKMWVLNFPSLNFCKENENKTRVGRDYNNFTDSIIKFLK